MNGRPDQVGSWVSSKKKALIPEIDVLKFGPQWMRWWGNLQPGWRTAEDGHLTVREIPSDADWTALCKGGTAGVYTLVVSLAWWVGQTREGMDEDVWAAVDDVQWALNTLASSFDINANKNKRSRDDATAVEGPRKRWVVLFVRRNPL